VTVGRVSAAAGLRHKWPDRLLAGAVDKGLFNRGPPEVLPQRPAGKLVREPAHRRVRLQVSAELGMAMSRLYAEQEGQWR